MSDETHLRVLKSPSFQKLVSTRSRFGWILSIAMLVIYYGFIALVAFAKPLMAARIGTGVTSVGIVLGFLVIVSAFVLTGIYVRRANSEFDALNRALREELK